METRVGAACGRLGTIRSGGTIVESADYGLDAPAVVRNLLVIGGALILMGILARIVDIRLLSWWGLLSGSSVFETGLLMVWGSRVGKCRLVTRAIDRLALRGGERILDVGSGHGLLLIAAAKKLATGRATGVDIWRERDQADNRPAVTLRNADLEGVCDRVRLCDGDARALPFADASFDVVVSSLAIHNIAGRTDRTQALHEIARVVRPAGRILIIDIARTAEYAQILRDARFGEVQRSGPNFMSSFQYTSWQPFGDRSALRAAVATMVGAPGGRTSSSPA